MDVGEGVAVGTTILGALAWLFRLEGRVSTHEAVCAERQRGLTERLDAIRATAAKQDEKLDRLVEHLSGQ